jgi:hypothetical protein
VILLDCESRTHTPLRFAGKPAERGALGAKRTFNANRMAGTGQKPTHGDAHFWSGTRPDCAESYSLKIDAGCVFVSIAFGMGLSICRSIIEEHEGQLWMTADKGRSAIFHLTVPADPGSAS